MTTQWWEFLYDEYLAEVLLVRSDQDELDRTVRFLVETLKLSGDDRVFDQCCGIGSLSIPLARAGLSVVGVDQAEIYIARARTAVDPALVTAEFVVGDAFEYVPNTLCDAAFNWWTSFGYADTDANNIRMLCRAYESLRPGGRFALDFLNLPGVLRKFQPHVVTRRNTPMGEIVLVRETQISPDDGFMKKTWTYFMPDGKRKESASRLRLYMPHQIAAMLRTAGFSEIELLGGISGEPLGLDSSRCIAIATREA